MKHQALFPRKDKSKELKYRVLQFLFGAQRVNKLEMFLRGSKLTQNEAIAEHSIL